MREAEEEHERLGQCVLDLQQRAGQGEEDTATLATKLQHRATQVEELQRDLRDRTKDLTAAQREVWAHTTFFYCHWGQSV